MITFTMPWNTPACSAYFNIYPHTWIGRFIRPSYSHQDYAELIEAGIPDENIPTCFKDFADEEDREESTRYSPLTLRVIARYKRISDD